MELKNKSGNIIYSKERLYIIWNHIKTRCNNPKDKSYKHYGLRGIKMCEEWSNNYYNFRNWALNNGYRDNLTIERKNNNLGYNPENCTWITNKEQQSNKSTNIFIEYLGNIHTLKEWSIITKIPYNTLWNRYRNFKNPNHERLYEILLKDNKHTPKYDLNEKIECACGCGTIITKCDGHRRERRFVSGHNSWGSRRIS